MTGRIIAVMLIFAATSVAWMFLGTKTTARTNELDGRLRGKVAGLWGKAQVQEAPRITYHYKKEETRKETVLGKDNKVESVKTFVDVVDVCKALDLDSSNINVALRLDHRKKGLLWYSLYGVDFSGRYTATNQSYPDGWFRITMPLPDAKAVYDDFRFMVNGREVAFTKGDISTSTEQGLITYTLPAKAGDSIVFETGYRSQGMDRWLYEFGAEGVSKINNFRLAMKTDFEDIDFPDSSLSATTKAKKGNGWGLTWEYKNLISGYSIGMLMPEKINPGPLASSISYFAPVSLLFFFTFIFIVSTMKNIRMHPMNYFFLAAAFFAFHLLFSYTVDHINIYLAFAISSFVSVFLVVSYMRLVVDPGFAVTYAGISQVIYLVFFSYAFFLEGFTGLTVTIGAIFTLFVLMQMTGKVDWEEKFKPNGTPVRKPAVNPAGVRTAPPSAES
ncbi:MAG: inner membrane CreD family protein [Nitrospirae bacterium]|nr:inner membrane CreD family protein [Nitrospirota bacterium]